MPRPVIFILLMLPILGVSQKGRPEIDTKFPVMRVTIDRECLFNEDTGIYVRGSAAYFSDSADKYVNCNHNKSWERPARVTYYVGDSVAFDQDCGLRLFGETTRRYVDKSMRIIARKKYGKKRFEYPVFSSKPDIDEYKHLVIRTSGNDYKNTRFKDALNSTFAAEVGLTHQAFQPIQLFVNDEYWGVYNLREKFNQHFFDENYGIDDDSDSIEMFMGRWVREEGRSARRYMEMYRWFETLDTMDDESYEQAKRYLDIKSFIDWRIIQIFINNPDARGNVRYWRVTHPDSTFKMVFYDTDHSWTYWYRNMHEKLLSEEQTEWYNPEWATMYFRRLMEHPDFKAQYAQRAAHLLNVMFAKDTLLAKIDRFQALYENELPFDDDEVARHLRRKIFSKGEWLAELEEMREFARNRPSKMLSNMVDALDLEGTFILSIDGNIGKVRINGSNPVSLPYEGVYIEGIPLTVEVLTDTIFKFVSWSEYGDNERITIMSDGEMVSLTPKFEQAQKPSADNQEPLKRRRGMIMEEESTELIQHDYAWIISVVFFAIFAAGLIYGAWRDVRRPQ